MESLSQQLRTSKVSKTKLDFFRMRRENPPIKINTIHSKTHQLDRPLFSWQLDTFYPPSHHVEVISAAHASRVGASSILNRSRKRGKIRRSAKTPWKSTNSQTLKMMLFWNSMFLSTLRLVVCLW